MEVEKSAVLYRMEPEPDPTLYDQKVANSHAQS